MLGNFHIDENNGIPLWIQLKSRIAFLIQSEYYHPGEQLPTVRELAIDQKVNYNTVSKVYLALERDGLIESRRGRGTFVSENLHDVNFGEAVIYANALADELVRKSLEAGMSRDDILKCINDSINRMNV